MNIWYSSANEVYSTVQNIPDVVDGQYGQPMGTNINSSKFTSISMY